MNPFRSPDRWSPSFSSPRWSSSFSLPGGWIFTPPPRRRAAALRAAALAVCQLLSISLFAQAPANAPSAAPSRFTNGLVAPPPLPEPMLVLRSPVELFRELMVMTPAERKQALTNRPPESRQLILAKLRQYESLKPDERELRLRVTELRWFLLPLMNMPATNRAPRIALIPEGTRPLVEARLRQWDLVPVDLQKELLTNEAVINVLADPNYQNGRLPANLSPAQSKKLEDGIARWRNLPEAQRRQVEKRFNEFFDLNAQEKEQFLKTLSEPERRQIEKTLRDFGNLTAAQRRQCLRSFEKFAGMSPEDRQQFLQNAERWKLMSPTERQAWRDLVQVMPIQPPWPDGLNSPPLPAPAPPRPLHSARPSAAVAATNSN